MPWVRRMHHRKSIQPCPNSQRDRLYLKPYHFKFRPTTVQVFYVFRFQFLPMSTINDNAPSTENVATVPGGAGGSLGAIGSSPPAGTAKTGAAVLETVVMNAIEKVSEKRRRDDQAALEQADDISADFMANEQKAPRDWPSYLDACCYVKAAEWTDQLQLRAQIGIEATHQLASELRVGLTAADHCFNNIIGTRIPKGEKAEALMRKQKDWALRTAECCVRPEAEVQFSTKIVQTTPFSTIRLANPQPPEPVKGDSNTEPLSCPVTMVTWDQPIELEVPVHYCVTCRKQFSI
ncbi:hypothetical protein VOLCADRAFT_93460 [Volvox carteri f. nagariensis]|uniref:Uncharacterized protein n=1 Tax=Volvox carteri f. nagariensis TaxID=3068 RepID=D8U267_VOLCA|nr:uncharacterized protein VOLCADRAFT_93460 [Volvox carteri f. nagariensis]EFJ46311.1 hypothetical protein VOLCADRAFT_93460 [Volvox carteri f. nagariensis]|eukprot:XP_002952758.1 hypothetical protein VOLCADRAFT_93460 [Volvox carteri f. nagariensis]